MSTDLSSQHDRPPGYLAGPCPQPLLDTAILRDTPATRPACSSPKLHAGAAGWSRSAPSQAAA